MPKKSKSKGEKLPRAKERKKRNMTIKSWQLARLERSIKSLAATCRF